MLLLDYARSLGVAMGSILSPGNGSRHAGWTTNRKIVEKLRKAGAVVTNAYGADDVNMDIPSGTTPKSPDTPMGWEISFAQGQKVWVGLGGSE